MRIIAPLLVSFAFVTCYSSHAQWQPVNISSSDNGPIYHLNGNVGIGLNNPTSLLHVSSTNYEVPPVQISTGDAYMKFTHHTISLESKSNFNYVPYLQWVTKEGIRQAFLGWRPGVFNLTLENGFDFSINGGNVGIGTFDTRGFRLAVAGKTITEEVVVQVASSWPDYVFSDSYKLPSLSDLEQYIKANRHLPDVPTAEDIKDEGLNIGEMNAILLKKVEELTLHLIEQNRINTLQAERIDNLERDLEKLKNR